MKIVKTINYKNAIADSDILTDNFAGIMRILKILDETLDDDEEKVARLTEFAAGISEKRFLVYLQMLAEDNLADVQFIQTIGSPPVADLESASITIKGMSFLQENSKLKKILAAVEKIAEFVK